MTKVLQTGRKVCGKTRDIPHYEQCLLFSQFFQKTCTADTQKQGLVCERVNCCCGIKG